FIAEALQSPLRTSQLLDDPWLEWSDRVKEAKAALDQAQRESAIEPAATTPESARSIVKLEADVEAADKQLQVGKRIAELRVEARTDSNGTLRGVDALREYSDLFKDEDFALRQALPLGFGRMQIDERVARGMTRNPLRYVFSAVIDDRLRLDEEPSKVT